MGLRSCGAFSPSAWFILLIYRSTLTMHEDESLYLDDASQHMQKEQTELLVKVNRLTDPGLGFRRRFRSAAAGARRHVHLSGTERSAVIRLPGGRRLGNTSTEGGCVFRDCWSQADAHLYLSDSIPLDTSKELHPLCIIVSVCESGGIGRRTRLRIWRVKPWGFESPLSHHNSLVASSFLLYSSLLY